MATDNLFLCLEITPGQNFYSGSKFYFNILFTDAAAAGSAAGAVAPVAAVALFVAGFALWLLLFWLLLVFRGSRCCRSVAPVAAMALSSLAFCFRRCRSVAPVAAVALFSLNMEGHT